ncbi:LmeA family phospholipid-binding protein [Actinoplanes sp. CA-030573]|uniref:LmeA family phospholipid-binding protein n=1 Tax=Actinoplanes sp. CA-030573 TaxID=3239898 RepID=UPI003D90CFCD
MSAVVAANLSILLNHYGAKAAAGFIDAQISSGLESAGIGPASAHVSFGDGLFLPQLAHGRYRLVIVDIGNMPLAAGDGQFVKIEQLHVEARDIRVSLGDWNTLVVGSLRGTALISYKQIGQYLDQFGLKLSYYSDKLHVYGELQILGRDLTISGVAVLRLSDNKVNVHLVDVEVDGDSKVLDEDLVKAYAQSYSSTFAIPPLPYSLSVSRIVPTSSGVSVVLSGRDVVLPKS